MIEKYVNGDLLLAFQESELDAIVHGCNCFHAMKSGIAAQISSQFSIAYDADRKTEYGCWGKLGDYSRAVTVYGEIINAYTQFRPGKYPEHLLYSNIERVFTQLNSDYAGKRIGIPKIGAGIAGGNWDEIVKIIEKCTPDLKICIYYI